MHSLQQSIASWASIVATLLTVVGVIQSEAWLTTISVVLLCASIVIGALARRERLKIKAATITVEGRSIDSLNLANLARRANHTLFIQDVNRVVTIDGDDLRISSTYSGFCRARGETKFEFSIDTDNNVPFTNLQCWGYDLLRDPKMKHPIRPMLQGTDGNSKKIVLPFLGPLAAHQPFNFLLRSTLPGCMKSGIEYYAATLSFDQDEVPRSFVHLKFIGVMPDWLRVYEVQASKVPKLLRDLPFTIEGPEYREYFDESAHLPGQSARIYLFSRGQS